MERLLSGGSTPQLGLEEPSAGGELHAAAAAAALAGELAAYEQQQAEVAAMLLDDPENEELQDIYRNLEEVIELSRELQQARPAEAGVQREQHEHLAGPAAAAAPAGTGALVACDATVSALLPPQVTEQIKHAQLRAAFAGQGPAAWAVGAKCRAVYSGDGNWYNGQVESATAGGGFVVLFDGYGTQEEVGRDAIQLRAADDEGGYKGVAAPKRRRVDDSVEVLEVPKWLEVKPTDDDKTRQKKRKLAKAFKSKARFAKLDLQQKQKAEAWKQFMSGAPSKKTLGKKK